MEDWRLQLAWTARLAVKAEAISYSADSGILSRVEESGSVLLLQAIPADLQSDAVSTRGVCCVGLIFLGMTRIQPGGGSEKAAILALLHINA